MLILISILSGCLLITIFTVIYLLIINHQNKQNKNIEETKWTNIYDKKVNELNRNLSTINANLGSIVTIKNEVQSISKLLVQNNKAGKAGEYLLNRIFNNITNTKSAQHIAFVEQYTMVKTNRNGNKLVVDLMIKGHGKYSNIPVDSKFPFNDYCLYLEGLENNLERKVIDNYKKAFFDAIKGHINKVTDYISPELDNAPYAIMFIPSESIAAFIFAEHNQLIDYAFAKQVIIAAPSTLMAIIQSIDYYLKIFTDIKNVSHDLIKIKEIEHAMENYDKILFELENSAKKVVDRIGEVRKKEATLIKKFQKLRTCSPIIDEENPVQISKLIETAPIENNLVN